MKTPRTRWLLLALPLTIACDDVKDAGHDHDHDHNHGLVTSLVMNFTPTDGGETLSFEWADPEGDGDPIIDDILLPDAADDTVHTAREYTLDLEVWNDLEDPAEDVTIEIVELASEHQFFLTGSAVDGPATGDNPGALLGHEYADSDENGLPLGLSNTLTTLAWGTGELTVTLRHLPPENDEAVKVEGLAEEVASDGFTAIGGDNDIQVTFNIEVE